MTLTFLPWSGGYPCSLLLDLDARVAIQIASKIRYKRKYFLLGFLESLLGIQLPCCEEVQAALIRRMGRN